MNFKLFLILLLNLLKFYASNWYFFIIYLIQKSNFEVFLFLLLNKYFFSQVDKLFFCCQLPVKMWFVVVIIFNSLVSHLKVFTQRVTYVNKTNDEILLLRHILGLWKEYREKGDDLHTKYNTKEGGILISSHFWGDFWWLEVPKKTWLLVA